MKRLSLLKKIALCSGAVAAATPIALMSMTSCAIEYASADYIDFNSILNIGDYSNAVTSNVPYKRLLFGSNKVCNGNYVLIYGSNVFDNTCKFFSGSTIHRERKQWFTNWSAQTPYGRFNDSPFFYGIQKATGKSFTNFGIFNVIDFFDFKVYDKKGHQIYISDKPDNRLDVINPWDKWTDEIINQTKLYNNSDNVPEKYEWDEKSVTTSEYIRNDTSAVLFREFCKTGALAYPKTKDRTETFDTSDKNKASKMMVFKNGKLQQYEKKDIFDIPTDKDAWYKIIETFFSNEEKKS